MKVWGSVVTFAIWALGSLFISFANRGTSYGDNDLMSYLQKEQKENVSIQLQHHFLLFLT